MQKVIQHTSKFNILMGLTVLVLGIALYNICKIPLVTQAETYGTAFSVEDETYLNVAIPSSVTLNITPTANGQFAKTSMDIDVNTNNATGYTLTMTADTTSLSRTSAVNGIDYSIPTLTTATTCTDESATTCDEFPVGYWGYKYTNAEVADSSTYNPMTIAASPIRFLKEFKNTTDTTTITFGTKLSNSIPNGTYDGVNLTFIATTNYVIPGTATYMQDFNAVIADSLTSGITYTTKDSRDQEIYNIARLDDDNVWMLDNLRLGGNSSINLTSIDTNTNPNLNGGAFTLPATSNFVNASRDEPMINTSKKNDTNAKGYKYGNYYNYCAATVNNRCNENYSGNVQYDICPKNWHIPSPSEYNELIKVYGSSAAVINNARLALAGGISDGTITYLDGIGSFWSSSQNYNFAAKLYVDNYGGIGMSDSDRTSGVSVRCIKDRSMQNFSATDATAMSEGQTITLVDNRDNKEYKVTKINGRVWMTQNLAFTGTTLTPSDSNVSTDTTMTYYSLDSSDDNYYNNGVAMCDSTNGYNNACIKDSGNAETGVWYNYAAASAGTITGSSNTTPATSDVCPKGWHLPSGPASTTGTDFYGIFQSTTSDEWINTHNNITAFSPVNGGYYLNSGTLDNISRGYWWSAIAGNTTGRYSLNYNTNNAQASSINRYRTYGYYVRCIFGN